MLGQTSTTDAVVGGLGSGKEHREVQKDIETADARALAAILNRDLIRPWMDLEFGPAPAYPRIRIERPEAEDLTAMSAALGVLVPLGLRVSMTEVRDRFGFGDPAETDEILAPAPAAAPRVDPAQPGSPVKGFSGLFKGVGGDADTRTAPQAEGLPAGKSEAPGAADLIADRLVVEAAPAMEIMLDQIEAMIAAAGSLGELREMLAAGLPDLDIGALSAVIAEAMLAAHAGGRAMLEDGGD